MMLSCQSLHRSHQQIGLLASVGVTNVSVIRKPTVAILSTGDEVVEPSTQPLPFGKIRDSNRPMLISALASYGYNCTDLGIAPDDPAAVAELLARGFTHDVLITSGGVSMGGWFEIRYYTSYSVI